MNKTGTIVALFVILALGGITSGSALGQNKSEKPLILDSFAAQKISPYETWKIYLKVSDPDGDMRSVYALVEQIGVGPYPAGITRLKKGMEKEFSGYLYLNFLGPNPSILNFAHLNLTLWIQDRSGNFSDPVRFPLSLNVRYVPEGPSPGIFQENDLGPIMIRLRPVSESAQLLWNE